MENRTIFLRDINLGSTGSEGESSTKGPRAEPAKIYELFREIQDDSLEKLVSIAVDKELQIINFDVIAIGPLSNIGKDLKYLFRSSVAFAAPGVVVVHNHSSGDPTPDDTDKSFHEDVSDVYRRLGIEYHDHIIIGDGRYYSFSAGKEFQC